MTCSRKSRRPGEASVWRRCSVLLAVNSILAALCASSVSADQIKVTPSLDLREEFNDNILFSTITKKSDVVTTVAPALEFSDRSSDFSIGILGGVNWLNYAKTTTLNAVDYQYRGQAAFQLSPLMNIRADGSYVRNSRPDTINQLTGLSSGAGSDRQSYSLSASQSIDELTSGTLSYSYVRESYDNPALLGSTVHTAGMAVNRTLTKVMSAAVSTGYSRNIYRDSESEDYSLGIGSNWRPSERFALNASVGGRYTHSTFLVTRTTEGRSDNWGVTGLLALDYTGETNRASLSFTRDFAAASGQIGATERTRVALTMGRRFLEKLAGEAALTYTINSSPGGQFSSQGAEDKAIRCSANLDYELSRHLSAGLQYVFYRIDYSPSRQSAVQNMALVQLRWQYPLDKVNVVGNKVSFIENK